MADMNTLMVTGHLTKDAIVKTVGAGKTLLTFDLANNIGFGAYVKTNYYTVNIWGERCLNLAQYLKKGTHVGVVGEESLNTWVGTQDGVEHQNRVITANGLTFLGSGQKQKNKADDGPECSNPNGDGPDYPAF